MNDIEIRPGFFKKNTIKKSGLWDDPTSAACCDPDPGICCDELPVHRGGVFTSSQPTGPSSFRGPINAPAVVPCESWEYTYDDCVEGFKEILTSTLVPSGCVQGTLPDAEEGPVACE